MTATRKGKALGFAMLNASGRISSTNTAQATAVADQGALASSAPAALTAVAAAGANPTKAEFDALLADVTALRTVIANLVTDVGSGRTKINAELAVLRTAGLQAT